MGMQMPELAVPFGILRSGLWCPTPFSGAPPHSSTPLLFRPGAVGKRACLDSSPNCNSSPEPPANQPPEPRNHLPPPRPFGILHRWSQTASHRIPHTCNACSQIARAPPAGRKKRKQDSEPPPRTRLHSPRRQPVQRRPAELAGTPPEGELRYRYLILSPRGRPYSAAAWSPSSDKRPSPPHGTQLPPRAFPSFGPAPSSQGQVRLAEV